MEIFKVLKQGEYEEVVFFYDKVTNLKAIVAIHDTTLGPALGGCRMYDYKNEEEALTDVLNLAKGMTYKAAAAGLDLGGGKSVIIGDSKLHKNEYLLRSFAKNIQTLAGRYIVSKDVGITVDDLYTFKSETNFVTGLLKDPSIFTAYGVLQGIKAAIKFKNNNENLKGLKVAIQGVGAVGYELAKLLYHAGCQLYVTDINVTNLERVKAEFQATIVNGDEIYNIDCDIFAPCAMGGTINEHSIEKMQAKIIAGSANNQLSNDAIGKLLTAKGILYVPDYIINAGGLIAVAIELQNYNEEEIFKKCDLIHWRLLDIFNDAERENISTVEAANNYVQNHLEILAQLKRRYV